MGDSGRLMNERDHLDPLGAIARYRVVPIVEVPSVDAAERLGEALVEGGLPIVEITLRTAVALDAVERLAVHQPDLLVGAGTILTADQARRAVDAGARFLIAPGLNLAVTRHAATLGVPMIPGVATPTEIEAAVADGLTTLKLFPVGALGGLAYLTAISAPYAGVRFVPTGGVGPDTMADYLAVPTVLAVGGTWIARSTALAGGDFEGIRGRIAEAVRLADGTSNQGP
jgi:2-dehydro-3-deoxyphosphogluconate aldolase/(4S)-4-hydroxy-2-oxoglutarate aldolase